MSGEPRHLNTSDQILQDLQAEIGRLLTVER
jgi:hypothetical protein